MELGLVLTLCGLGVAFWIPALIIAFISHGKKKNCTMNTIGLVIRINSRSSGDSGLNFYPVYEYYVNGIHIRTKEHRSSIMFRRWVREFR